MKIEDVRKLTPIQRLEYWVAERHSIYTKKAQGLPKPWSDDVIFQSTYFTNVCRELDKVTIWLRENLRDPLRDKPEVIFATIAFRWFNLPATGESLMSFNVGGSEKIKANWEMSHFGQFIDWHTAEVVKALTVLRSRGNQIFTGAFNISGGGSTKPKINHVCEDYLEPIWTDRANLYRKAEEWTTLEAAFNDLSEYPGFGGTGFMAAQCVADLKYTCWLEKATDWWTWASSGPGSYRGLNRVLGRDIDKKLPRSKWLEGVNLLRRRLNRGVCRSRGMPELHAQDTQNCLCEYDKMERILWSQGRSKRKYPGR